MKLVEKNKCSGCTACMNICPKKCIKMVPDDEGFLYPKIDEKLCIDCGLCIKTCPVAKINLKNELVKAYAVKNKDDDARLNSTSGAVFTAISKYVFNNNGVVVGCKFDDKFHAVHDFAENLKEMETFRGAKYVQSILEDIFKKTKDFLDSGRLVLFTGTPCQIAGLSSYLNKEYTNLIKCDLVCHSVPSPKALRAYMDELEDKNSSKITNLVLREKQLNGWSTSNIKVEFENKEIYRELLKDTSFMQGFNKGLFNRPSCANCVYKNFSGSADITIGDYWGIEIKNSKFADNLGVSLVFVNNNRGEEIFNKIKDNIEYIETPVSEATVKNPYVVTSSPAHKNRDEFFSSMNEEKFSDLVLRLLD